MPQQAEKIINVQNILQQKKMRFCKIGGGETVWLNPPYGRNIGVWVKKAYEESQKPGTTVVMLVPSRTDTAWFHDYIFGKAKIRFVRGQLKFGKSKNSAPFPSLVAIYEWEGV